MRDKAQDIRENETVNPKSSYKFFDGLRIKKHTINPYGDGTFLFHLFLLVNFN